MTWHARDSIALIELIFYIPFAGLTGYVCYKHGFGRSSGWLFTFILCIIRIIGGIMQFVSHNNPSAGLYQAIVILDSVGLSPLLLATLGLLSRFVDSINSASAPRFTIAHFRIIQTVLLVGMILAIVGGTSVTIDANGTYHTPATSKVGVILYIIGFAAIALLFLLSFPKISIVPNKERRVPIAIAVALPFICVRLLYSVLSVFIHNHLFSTATGSVPIRVGMSVIEEFIVVTVYAVMGLLVDKLDAASKGPIASRPWSGKKKLRAHQTKYTPVDTESQYMAGYPAAVPLSYPQSNGVGR